MESTRHPKPGLQPHYHQFELAICGYKNSGKTSLIVSLVRALSKKYNLAYLKHDAHHFELDHQGKDTWLVKQAGAHEVTIANAEKFGHYGGGEQASMLDTFQFLSCDALLVEGHKMSSMQRVMLVDQEATIFDDPAWTDSPPLAVVMPWQTNTAAWQRCIDQARARFGTIPCFFRNDIDQIASFVEGLWQRKKPALFGLILTGGKSQRMGSDKALLPYHGQSQIKRAAALLEQTCQEVFVSCRADQEHDPVRSKYESIADSFAAMGPTSGILSALRFGNERAKQTAGLPPAWLVLACDLPKVDAHVLAQLTQARDFFRFATAFYNSDGLPEPLCTIYEPKAYGRLLQFIARAYECPRKFLINSRIKTLAPPSPDCLDNANSPEDYQRISHDLSS